jgi:hypothetical protein
MPKRSRGSRSLRVANPRLRRRTRPPPEAPIAIFFVEVNNVTNGMAAASDKTVVALEETPHDVTNHSQE